MRRLARIALVALALLAAIGALVPFLPSLLDVTDPVPASADAIFVFAGDVPERSRCAAELYRRGVASRVVFSGGVVRPEVAAVGQPLTEAALNARIARDAGVPESAVIVIPEGTSTWEDAEVLRRWSATSGAKRIVAVTSPLHARRARRTLRAVLGGDGIDVALVACGRRLGPASGWWWEERSLIAVSNEVLKLGLYAVRYFLPAAIGRSPAATTPAEVP